MEVMEDSIAQCTGLSIEFILTFKAYKVINTQQDIFSGTHGTPGISGMSAAEHDKDLFSGT